MKHAELEGRVRRVVAEAVKVDVASVGGRTPFSELGLDWASRWARSRSVAQLEDAFDLRIPKRRDALHLTTVDAVVRYVARNATTGSAPASEHRHDVARRDPHARRGPVFETALRRGDRSLTLFSSRSGGKSEALPYADLLARPAARPRGSRPAGRSGAGAPFMFVGATGLDEVVTLLGALLLGAHPALVSPPVGLVGLEGWVARVCDSRGARGHGRRGRGEHDRLPQDPRRDPPARRLREAAPLRAGPAGGEGRRGLLQHVGQHGRPQGGGSSATTTRRPDLST